MLSFQQLPHNTMYTAATSREKESAHGIIQQKSREMVHKLPDRDKRWFLLPNTLYASLHEVKRLALGGWIPSCLFKEKYKWIEKPNCIYHINSYFNIKKVQIYTCTAKRWHQTKDLNDSHVKRRCTGKKSGQISKLDIWLLVTLHVYIYLGYQSADKIFGCEKMEAYGKCHGSGHA